MSSLHQRAKDVFLVALAQSGPDRSAFLADACGDDTALRAEVESLLHFHETTGSSEPEPPVEAAQFAPGQMFAGRYRMVARIGRGGMGDVWRADDVILQTPVALKLIASTANDLAGRILNEVRVARQITHPAVCRVFDVGNADGVVFFTMELVDGEDLAALARRVGRLPSEKVNDIARQLCGGLAAAHAQGVLHRDLKPGNVLIDNHGQVRITDFGIAIWQAQPVSHSLTGTPAYMAPEQRTLGATLSPQTDIYALGLVLYELLVGQHPFKHGGAGVAPARPSSVVPNVDPQLERVIMDALSIDPIGRPASATEFAAQLAQPAVRAASDTSRTAVSVSGRRASWWIVGPAVAAVVGAIAVALTFVISPRAGARTLTAQDTIVIADFENTTNEPVFDGALKVALAVALEQSPFLKVFPDDRARDTLRLMERSPEERITRALARDLARREQLKALISGSIASLGSNYVIALEAVNADTGDVMAREQAEATSKEQVLTSLGAASARLRERLGESLASVQKFDAPLPRATTPSLDALHAYSLALSDGREVPRLESIPQLKRAIELDPTFAMAHAQLSAVYANTGQSTLAPAYSQRAFELRDRVSERERFFISWRYYRDAVQAWDKGLELARSWTAAYPREAFAFNSLGAALIRFGDFDASVEPFRQAIRLDPRFVPAYGNLAASLLALNRLTEARAVLQDAAAKQLDFPGARRLSYLLAFVQGDSATMARELEASLGVGETNAAFGWQADASAFEGKVKRAHDEFARGIQMSRQGNFTEVAAQLTMEDAEVHAIAGQCGDARTEVTAGLALSRDNGTLEHASRALALCGAEREAMELSSELARRFPDATFTMRIAIPLTAAVVALERGNAERAIELLEPVRRFDHAPSAEFWPAYLRGQAYLQLKNGQAAAAEFQNVIAHRGEVPAWMLYPLAHLGLARAAMLSHDTATARQSYEQFLVLWKSADAGLRAVSEARSEQAALGLR
jgi:eukaryotic-like serine/threonine-protein kinase